MFENERDFQKAVSGLKIDTEPSPAHRERLRRQMLATFEAAGRSAETPSPSETPTRTRLVFPTLAKLAAAAVIAVAAVVGVQQLVQIGGGPLTFAQVRQATQRMAWLHAAVTVYRDGQARTDQQWDHFAARRAYTLSADGSVLHSDYGPEQKEFVYSPRVKAMAISELPSRGPLGAASAYTLVDAFAVFAAEDGAALSEWTDQHEGQAVWVFEIGRSDPLIKVDGQAVATLKIRLMADQQTRRLVAARIEKNDRRGTLLAREEWAVTYPESGPASIYELGVPRTARVVDRTIEAIGTPGQKPAPVATPEDAGRSKDIPVHIDLPKALFVGTPQDNRVANLARPRRGPRPPFLAPPGTRNVALRKPVSSSDTEPVVGTLDMITDGDKEAADGSFVELGPGVQYVTLDLQARHEIYAVVIWHYHQQPRVYFDVVVQVSNDRRFQRGVQTVFNNDIDNSADRQTGRDLHYTETNEGKLIDTRGVEARYVRLYSNGNTSDGLNHYIEVEVYGRPVR
ncbi:MAG: hypothetical protein ACYTAS_00915 [Planctomycetota bacterium]|jgi:hypothetical protein